MTINVDKCKLCSLCNAVCPFFVNEAKEHRSPRGWIHLLQNNKSPEALQKVASFCLFCNRCTESCPIDIDLPGYLLHRLYEQYNEKGWAFRFKEESQEIFLELQTPGIFQPGYKPYPFELTESCQLDSLKDLTTIFPQHRLIINSLFINTMAWNFEKNREEFPLEHRPKYYWLPYLTEYPELLVSVPEASIIPAISRNVFLPEAERWKKLCELAKKRNCV